MPRILHVKDLREMSLGERFLIFFFVVFPGNHTAANCITYGNARTGRKFVRPVVVEMMRNLVAAQVLAPGLAAKGVTDEAYRLSALFTAKALHLLAREAAKQGWWPTVETLAQGTPGDWMGAQLAYAIRNFVDPLHIWQIAETMKALLVGGTCVFGGLPKGVHYPLVSVHWSAVGHVLRLLAPQEEVPVEDLPAQGSELVLPVLFELGFLQGADLRPALTAARTLLGQVKTRVSVSTFCAFCALAVWTGQRDVLNGAASLVAPGSPAERFAALCLDVFEGRFAEAEKAFATGADSFRGVFSTDVSTPVWLLGIALALRQDAPLTRVSKYAKQLKQEPTALLNWHPVARDQLQGIAHRRTALVERLMEAGSSAWSPHAASDGGDAFVEARNLFLSGYPALAAILLAGVRRQAPEREGLDEFEKVLAAAGTVTLVKGVETEPKWKTALRALSERLPDAAGAAKGEATLNGTIGWQLALVPAARDQQWTCSALTPVYRGPRAAEDGRDDRRLTLKGLAGTKYRACLTSCDAEVLQVLLKNGYNPRIPNSVPEEALSLLCGHPRLVQTWAFVENEKMAPMELVRARCPLTTAKTAAGGMQLRLPDWLLDNPEQASVLFSSAQGRFQYYPLSKRVRDIAAIFAEQGVAGALEIPAEGVAEAQRLLVRLAGELAVAGDFAPDEAGDLAQVQGCTMPHVRLVYTNEALSLALVVEPIANRAVAVCEPGIGLAQRLV